MPLSTARCARGSRRRGVTLKKASKTGGLPTQRRAEESVKVAVYARASTHDQTAENQLIELRRYVATAAAGAPSSTWIFS